MELPTLVRPDDWVICPKRPARVFPRLPCESCTSAPEEETMKPRTTTDQPIAPDTVARWRAAAVAIAPLVLLAGFVYHPFLPFLTNPHAAAEAGSADTVRWGIAHLLVGVGSGCMILAFLAIRSLLREAGEDRWSIRALPFIVLGSVL